MNDRLNAAIVALGITIFLVRVACLAGLRFLDQLSQRRAGNDPATPRLRRPWLGKDPAEIAPPGPDESRRARSHGEPPR